MISDCLWILEGERVGLHTRHYGGQASSCLLRLCASVSDDPTHESRLTSQMVVD